MTSPSGLRLDVLVAIRGYPHVIGDDAVGIPFAELAPLAWPSCGGSVLRGPDEESPTVETALFEYLRAEISGPAEDTRQMLARTGLPMPEGLPAVPDMRLDRQGYLWVRRFSPPTEGGERWGIFAPEGAFLGHVTIPDDAALTDIGSDWIVATWWDRVGVPWVGLSPLRRTPSPPL